jgi:lysozyme
MSNTAPITLEQLFRYRRDLPHQRAAIPLMEADIRLNGYEEAMRRDRPWFEVWSQAGKQPDPPAARSWLRLTATSRINANGLQVLWLGYWRNGVEIDHLEVVSGAPGRQSFRLASASRAGSLEPLPEGRWGIADAEWATGRPDDYSGNWGPGLGPVSIPLAFVGPGRTDRAAIEIHIDSNARAGSPGTAGCIGLSGEGDYRTLMTWLRATDPRDLYVDWKLGSCPKP